MEKIESYERSAPIITVPPPAVKTPMFSVEYNGSSLDLKDTKKKYDIEALPRIFIRENSTYDFASYKDPRN